MGESSLRSVLFFNYSVTSIWYNRSSTKANVPENWLFSVISEFIAFAIDKFGGCMHVNLPKIDAISILKDSICWLVGSLNYKYLSFGFIYCSELSKAISAKVNSELSR